MPHQVTCTVCKNSYPTTLAFGQARCVYCGHMNTVISPSFANSSTKVSENTYVFETNNDAENTAVIDMAVSAVVDVVSAVIDTASDTFSGGGGDFGGGGSSDSW